MSVCQAPEQNLSNKSEVKNIFLQGIESLIKLADAYEINKPQSMVFIKLEEAMLWASVLVDQGKLKDEYLKKEDDKPLTNENVSC